MIYRIALTVMLALFSCETAFAADAPKDGPPTTRPALTDTEREAGWRLLFDGETTAGWHGLGIDGFPDARWNIKEGCLHCVGGKVGTNDLASNDTYENFELSWEWMVPKDKGNSGLKYRIVEKKGTKSALGPEFQMMADGDVVNKNATGSLYDVLPPHDKKVHPAGEFNTSRIVERGDHVEHWLNGVNVLEFDFGSDEVKAAVAKSKFKDSPVWAKAARGHIVLQDHTDESYIRNIKIRELSAATK